ncbi:hypothetical protein CBR_g49428 [Chara braunii]|uniref:GDT1 family protein n=1 Tax=Chara braunii TaxID=69332 RepID=A0A388M580_CHABU|nr:hypothetical protein CBR_g49428 [Chara braunii]|eukprot:GBG89639.1 hypothetical protein CBR_g49428 [Chara braunii]
MAADDVAVLGFAEGLVKSLFMTILSEVGDKTFFVAALLAMRHPRSSVMAGSLGALLLMTVLSVFLGWAAPSLISPKLMQHVATVLFLAFGIKSLIDVVSNGEEGSSELEEVEAELDKDLKNTACSQSQSIVDKTQVEKNGGNVGEPADKVCVQQSTQRQLLCCLFSPVSIQAFSLAFFSEWGDKSQRAASMQPVLYLAIL